MTEMNDTIKAQQAAYKNGRDEVLKGRDARPEDYPNERVRVAYEAGRSYGEAAKRNGWTD